MSDNPVHVVGGWSPTTTVAGLQLIVTVLLGGGGLYGVARGLALLWKMSNESRKQDSDAATTVRREMMEFNAALQARITALEDSGREERKRFDDEIAATRKEHAQEVISIRKGYETQIRELREELNGLRRQMAQWAQSSRSAQILGKTAPTSAMKQVEDAGLGDVLRGMYDIKGTGEDD